MKVILYNLCYDADVEYSSENHFVVLERELPSQDKI